MKTEQEIQEYLTRLEGLQSVRKIGTRTGCINGLKWVLNDSNKIDEITTEVKDGLA